MGFQVTIHFPECFPESATISAVFSQLIKSINNRTEGEVVAIDGKSYVILMIKGRAGSTMVSALPQKID